MAFFKLFNEAYASASRTTRQTNKTWTPRITKKKRINSCVCVCVYFDYDEKFVEAVDFLLKHGGERVEATLGVGMEERLWRLLDVDLLDEARQYAVGQVEDDLVVGLAAAARADARLHVQNCLDQMIRLLSLQQATIIQIN